MYKSAPQQKLHAYSKAGLIKILSYKKLQLKIFGRLQYNCGMWVGE